MELKRQLIHNLMVYTPAMWLTSREEPRCLALLKSVAQGLAPSRDIYLWSCTHGLRQRLGESGPEDTQDLITALGACYQQRRDGAIVILLDPDLSDPKAARAVRDLLGEHRPGNRCLVVVSPVANIHPTLRQTFIELTLPPLSPRALGKVLDQTIDRFTTHTGRDVSMHPALRERLCLAAGGMTQGEYERALGCLLYARGRISEADILTVQSEKCTLAAGDPLFRLEESLEDLTDIGGMSTYKSWVLSRKDALGGASPMEANIRGMLLVALPGCGQSIAVKGTAQAWGLPLIELDGMHLGVEGGPSPQEMRRALRKLEMSGPCLLWLPRLDMAFEQQGEAGGLPRSAAALVLERWLLNKERKTVVIAGAREPNRLPLDIVIRGAFAQIFFLDLPSSTERREILQIALTRRGIPWADLNLEMLVAASDGFSGAQIIQSIDRGLLEAPRSGEPLKMVDLLNSLRQTTPMAGYLGERRRRVRAWAHRWAIGVSGSQEG